MEFISEHFSALLLALIVLADTIVSLTPTKKDDQVLGYIKAIFNSIQKIGAEKDGSAKPNS